MRNALQRKLLPLETAFVICCLVNLPGNLKELQMESWLLFLLLRLKQKLAVQIHRSDVFSLEGWELNTAMCWEPACSQTKKKMYFPSDCCSCLGAVISYWVIMCCGSFHVLLLPLWSLGLNLRVIRTNLAFMWVSSIRLLIKPSQLNFFHLYPTLIPRVKVLLLEVWMPWNSSGKRQWM